MAENLAQVSLMLPPDVIDRIDHEAEREFRQRSPMIRVLIIEALQSRNNRAGLTPVVRDDEPTPTP